ncbi:hypothetical protein HPP92_018612 [Vanilla planifolia]|uniref:Uncharacterized protein n=1 Tax=Vanilla planifolia TaxID=51239 RepID=A0A835UN22_VANPL|nr:hypothetical protein HPP92_018612 [Vanilla planifolia]
MLKKAILLRRLAADTVLRSFSLKTLEILELIEEIDRENSGIRPSMAMKAAYCAIACSCTAAALRKSVADFLEVFVGIWVLRICDMEKSDAASLISDELRETRDIMWDAVKHSESRALLEFDESEESLERVRVYLEEVWGMEPFSPVLVADELYEYEEGLRRLRKGKGTDLKSSVIEMDVESENNDSFHVYVTPVDPGDGANISKGYPKRLNCAA